MLKTILISLLSGIAATVLLSLFITYIAAEGTTSWASPAVIGYMFAGGFMFGWVTDLFNNSARRTFRPGGDGPLDTAIAGVSIFSALFATLAFAIPALVLGVENYRASADDNHIRAMNIVSGFSWIALALALLGVLGTVWFSWLRITPQQSEDKLFFDRDQLLPPAVSKFYWWRRPKIQVVPLEQRVAFNFPGQAEEHRFKIPYFEQDLALKASWPVTVLVSLVNFREQFGESYNPKELTEKIVDAAHERAVLDLIGAPFTDVLLNRMERPIVIQSLGDDGEVACQVEKVHLGFQEGMFVAC